ncbi:MAG: ComF family protein [Firmicutes bacterium]|nr:ComF family protein [Bacillota bacterium]
MSEIRKWLKDWGQSLLDLVYAKSGACRLCQRSWVVGEFSSGRGDLCDDCRAALTACPEGLIPCPGCGRFFLPHDYGGDRCAECRSNPLPISAGVVVGPYTGMLRQAIHWYKFGRRKELADPLAMLLREQVKPIVEAGSGEDLLVIPVPLHRDRLKERGFNQSELLARAMIKRMESEPGDRPRLLLRTDILTRPVETPSQTGLKRSERMVNLVGAFQAEEGRGRELSGRRVLLVDDIITTGSTSGECARVLLEAGSGPVSLGVLAGGIIGKRS